MTHADAIPQSPSSRPRMDFEAHLGRARLRSHLFRILGSCATVAALAYMAYQYQNGPAVISTDDAYVDASLAQVTPQIDGTISKVVVHDTQYVKRGDILVSLDPADALLDVRAAKAAYEQAYRHVREDLANASAAAGTVRAKESVVAQARLQMQRRASIAQSGAVSTEEVSNARSAYDAAQYDLSIARQQLAAHQAKVKDLDLRNNPEILAALTVLQRAELRLERTRIRAPVDGVVAQFHAQVGQQIAVGTSLMSVVPVDQLFVEANFKEGQLDEIKPFQSVDLTSDLYGSRVVFHGYVEGLGGGTGAAFSVIPAQNATGNWIKVVQRLPVRIALDPDELKRNPLRVGISMNVSIRRDSKVSVTYSNEYPPHLRTASSAPF